MSIDHWDVERLAHGPTKAQENAWNAQPDTWSALNPGAPWAAHEDTVAEIETNPGYATINTANYWDHPSDAYNNGGTKMADSSYQNPMRPTTSDGRFALVPSHGAWHIEYTGKDERDRQLRDWHDNDQASEGAEDVETQ